MFPMLTCSSPKEIINIYFLHLNHACPTFRTIRGIKLVFTKQAPLLMLPKKKKKKNLIVTKHWNYKKKIQKVKLVPVKISKHEIRM